MQYSHVEFEQRYQRLQPAGVAVDYAGRSFDDFDLREFLTDCLPQMRFVAATPRALEYGTGTGPGACFLAARGFCVEAIDISPTAIAMARQFAAERDLQINYDVGDICTWAAPEDAYDLVVDSFCLHRIITDADRRRALANVRRMLRPRGYFVVGSVIYRESRDHGPDRFDSATGIVYARVGSDPGNYRDVTQMGGHWYYARHRHLPADEIARELSAAGFTVLDQAADSGRYFCQPK